MGKIIVIGRNNMCGDDDAALAVASTWLNDNGLSGTFDHYDMSTAPEKGDALDAIDASTEAVIALHVFGIDGRTGQVFGEGQWGYNRNNGDLHTICKALKIPLISVGDQPRADGVQLAPRVWVYASKS